MSQYLLEVNGLRTNYRVFEGELKVLDGLNLKIRPGEKVGLVGESGCGKTTTMKSILKILPRPVGRIVGGQILYKGKDLVPLPDKQVNRFLSNRVSAIFQNPTAALNPVFTVGQQLRDVIRYSHFEGVKKEWTKKEVENKAIEALQDVSMPDPKRILDNYPVQLSGGMRQRICIALALLTASDLLIADEPGTNLDVTIQDQILRLLIKLVEEKNTAIIYITHTLGVVRQYMDRVYVMYAGNTVEVAKTKDLFANPVHPYTKGLLEAVPKLTGKGISQGIPGRVPSYISPPKGCRFQTRCPIKIDKCSQEKPTFIDLGNEHKVACFRGGE